MSELSKNKNVVRTIMAGSVIGSLAFFGASQVGIQHEKNEESQAKAAESNAAAANETAAFKEARLLEAKLDTVTMAMKGDVSDVRIWQGIVSRPSAHGMDSQYIDPIVLSMGKDGKFGPSSDQTNPSYLGIIQGSPKEGIKVVPVAFTAGMKFDAAAPKNEVTREVTVYPSTLSYNGDEVGYQLFAYDPTGEAQVVHPYGHGLISPGRELQ